MLRKSFAIIATVLTFSSGISAYALGDCGRPGCTCVSCDCDSDCDCK